LKMGINMKVNLSTINVMAREFSHGPLVIVMKESFVMINVVAKEPIFGQVAGNTLVILKMTSVVDLGHTFTQTQVFMKEDSKMEFSKGLVAIIIEMAGNLKENL